ncbi:hypothetical protein M413DRAFT_22264 [Hebeloma cylindrosporum]|uniref:37S ribosomal protein S35, mitochondrial n=1 Tax=Hebeloma cylindrosporum TaxID=76867 RepID=A0A0C3CFW2_HEBCY|nr:hypothetical protein M413DRAFT_22264 [Hebeloma cylindrosporum h7]
MLNLSSTFHPCLRSLARPVASTSTALPRRAISASAPHSARRGPPIPEPDTPTEELDVTMTTEGSGERSNNPTSYKEFMEKMGYKYQYAKPQHYLGETPFPMNPSFKPPPPIANDQRTLMFHMFLQDPFRNGPRRLAKRFNLSLKRVDAILRLKGLENAWVKGKELQSGFQYGMEKLLGATSHSAVSKIRADMTKTHAALNEALGVEEKVPDSTDPTDPTFEPPQVNELRSDVHRADMLEEEEKRDSARARYERMYWESMPEDGSEPILPSVLQTAEQRAELRKLQKEIKVNEKFMVPPPPSKSKYLVRPKRQQFIVSRPKGLSTKFVDVGAQFLDYDERIKRLAVSQRRSRLRQRKSEEKQRAA